MSSIFKIIPSYEIFVKFVKFAAPLDSTLVKSFSRLASIVIEGGREGGREENGRARDVFRARVGRMIISVSIAAIFLYVRGGQKMSTNDGRGKAAERSHVPSSFRLPRR